ncbi:unnamed protein product [Meloidogyne enterolobii]|uniref:Uncharacterized protein n=1 Tax=Meloidogyne enterolobii TaxID=390850 RepID=A0ACB0Z775_MELEN
MALVRTYSALDLPSVGPYSLTRTYSVPSLTRYNHSYMPIINNIKKIFLVTPQFHIIILTIVGVIGTLIVTVTIGSLIIIGMIVIHIIQLILHSTIEAYFRIDVITTVTTSQILITGIIPTIIGAVTKAISMIMIGHTITDVGMDLPIIFEQENRRRMYKSPENSEKIQKNYFLYY